MVLVASLSSLVFGATLATPRTAHADATDEARRHFEAGVQNFEDQRFADAAVEFERSFELKPAWQVLYNLGSVYAALGRPVEAVDALTRYEQQAGAALTAERRGEVQAELERQRAKIATLQVHVNAPGAEVRIDSKLVGHSPLSGPIQLASGPHLIDVALDGRRPEHRELTLTAKQWHTVQIALVPLLATPREPPKAPPQPTSTPTSNSGGGSSGTVQRVIGYSIFGAGLVGAGVGIGLVAMGQSKHLDAVEAANGDDRPRAEQLESEANRQKTLGLATIGIGGAAILGGLVLLVTAPSNPPPRVAIRFSPIASASFGGLTVEGQFQ